MARGQHTGTGKPFMRGKVDHGLEPVRSYVQVAEAWEEQTGQKISRGMVYKILVSAERKLREGPRATAAEYFDDPALLDQEGGRHANS